MKAPTTLLKLDVGTALYSLLHSHSVHGGCSVESSVWTVSLMISD